MKCKPDPKLIYGKLHARKGAWLRMDVQVGGIYLVLITMVAAHDSSLK